KSAAKIGAACGRADQAAGKHGRAAADRADRYLFNGQESDGAVSVGAFGGRAVGGVCRAGGAEDERACAVEDLGGIRGVFAEQTTVRSSGAGSESGLAAASG